jgi:hypothetical protein
MRIKARPLFRRARKTGLASPLAKELFHTSLTIFDAPAKIPT